MFWLDFILVFFIAFLLVAILAAAGRGRFGEGWAGILWLFALILLVTWALGVWLVPVGPPLWGVSWVPFLVVAIFVVLLIAAIAEPTRRWPKTHGARKPLPSAEGETEPMGEREETEAAAMLGCGIFFWILIIVAIVAIVARYVS